MFLTFFPWLTPVALAFRNMGQRIARTLLTLLGIVLGVAVVLAIQITNESTLASINQLFDRAAGKANLLVIPKTGGGTVLDMSLIGKVSRVEGVEIAAPSLVVPAILAAEAGEWQIDLNVTGTAESNFLQLYGVEFPVDAQVRVYELKQGRFPEVDAYEVILTEQYAQEKSLALGDDLVILAPGGEERLRIVGLLSEQGVGVINDGAVAFAPLAVVQDVFERGGELDEIALRLSPAYASSPRQLEKAKALVEARVGRDGKVIYPAARGELVAKMLDTYQKGLSLFSIIAIFVGTFLVYNTFSMTVVERTREIGMLRALGMNRWQVIRMVLAEAVLLSLIGSVLGLIVGVFLARGLMVLMGALVSGGQNVFAISKSGILQSLGVGVGVTLGAALIPATQAANTSPLAALRVRGRVRQSVRPTIWFSGLALLFIGWALIYRLEFRQEVVFFAGSAAVVLTLLGATLTVPLVVNLMERLTRPLASLFYGNEGAIGASNLRRSVGRTTLTVASLMVALAMIIGVGSLAYSFEQDMSAWIDTALGGDLYVRSPVTMRESFARQLEAIPGVAAVTPARYLTVRVAPRSMPQDEEDDLLIMIAIDPDSYRKVGDLEFTAGQGDPEQNWATFTRGDAVFISTVVADRFRLGKGDTFYLQTHRGVRGFTVAGVVVDFTGQGYVINCSYQDMKRWFAESGADRFTVDVAEGYDITAVAEEIEARFKARKNISVQTTEVFKADIRGIMDQAFQLFDVLNLIGVIVGALGVVNTLTMNIIERQREIGGLRSLGMTRWQVVRMVLAEALALGTMGCIYGMVFGYFMAQTLILGVNKINAYDLEYIFTLQPFVLGAVLAFVISQGAAALPARRAARVNIVEAIKHE